LREIKRKCIRIAELDVVEDVESLNAELDGENT
jgi:hypothetical protein